MTKKVIQYSKRYLAINISLAVFREDNIFLKLQKKPSHDVSPSGHLLGLILYNKGPTETKPETLNTRCTQIVVSASKAYD